VPFDVLLDEDGEAADIVETNSLDATTLIKPNAWLAGARSLAGGNRQHKTGRRPTQLGATIVVAPGDEILYIDRESFAGDHANLDEVLAVLEGANS
jgi:hypothetical protein